MASGDMKVTGPNGAGPTARSGPSRSAPAGGQAFAPAEAGGAGVAARSTAASAMSTVASLDALIALQEVGGPLERRKRAAARGGRLLDALEKIKIGLLEGALPRAAVEALAREARDHRHMTDDPRLDMVLAEIETRAAVELAKLEAPLAAA